MPNEYHEKLKDPRWQKKRLEILERDGWSCKFCGSSEKTLHIHHLFYFKGKDPWEIHNGFLITLCEDCHFAEKQDDEDMSISECIVDDISLLLESIWGSGYDLPDIVDIARAISYAKKPKTGHLCGMKISAKYK